MPRLLRFLAPLSLAGMLVSAAPASPVEFGLTSFSVSAGKSYNKADLSPSGPKYSPELHLGGPFLFSGLRWSASWGYWNRSGGESSGGAQSTGAYSGADADRAEYSLTGHVLGARLTVFPNRSRWNPVRVGLFAGASRHFIRERGALPEERANGMTGGPGLTTLDLGTEVYVRLLGPLSLRSELRLVQPLDGNHGGDDPYLNRISVTAGVAYFPE